jgi:pyroglutamyl-peptidase
MTILLTGFEPFGGESRNPSWDAVAGLHGEHIELPDNSAQGQITRHAIHTLQLPTVFQQASAMLRANLAQLRPRLCICVGQAGGRALISLEKFAVNLAHARIADNAGVQPQLEKLDCRGPAAYVPNFRFDTALNALDAAGIDAELSVSAGSFVCNEVFYTLCQVQKRQQPALVGTFVHIPYAPEQTLDKPNQPSMALKDVRDALRVIMLSQLFCLGKT